MDMAQGRNGGGVTNDDITQTLGKKKANMDSYIASGHGNVIVGSTNS